MKTYDVVVIGGGVIGTSTAYQLSEKGYKVALVDMNDLASGTSSHCDAVALICDKKPGIDTLMGHTSIQLFKEFAEKFSYDFEFTQRGSLYVCETEQEYAHAEEYAKAQQDDGYDMRMLNMQEMKEREPFLADDLVGGIWTEEDSSMNPYLLCFAFVQEGKKHGLDVYPYSQVKDIVLDKDGAVEKVVTTKGELLTKRVVNCAGVWASDIGKMVGIDIPIKPRKGLILVTERTIKVCNQKVHEYGYMLSKFEDINFTRNVSERVEKYNVAFALEPTEAGNYLLGGNRLLTGMDIRTEYEATMAIAERGVRFFPILKDINCIRVYAGVRPYVEDHLPIVSEVEGIPGFYIAAGHEGDGISMSPVTGRFITQLISGEETDFDIRELSFSRFQKQEEGLRV